MAKRALPFDGMDLSEGDWEAYFSPVAEDGWIGSPGGPVGQLYADSSGKHSKMRAGSAWVHGFLYEWDVERLLPHANNTSAQPRIDRVVLRRDMITNGIAPVVKEGNPSSTPQPPALDQTLAGIWEIHIGQVRIESGFGTTGPLTIAPNKVADERRFTGMRIWPATLLGDLPASAPLWQEAVLASGAKYRFNGSGWVQVASPMDAAPTGWIGAVQSDALTRALAVQGNNSAGRYQITNGVVTGSVAVASADVKRDSGGSLRPQLPVPALSVQDSPVGTWYYAGMDGSYQTGILINNNASPQYPIAVSGYRPGLPTGGPMVTLLSVGDRFSWSFNYLAA